MSLADGTVMINNATVVFNDLLATNGIVHVIDKVLMPPVSSTVIDLAAGDSRFSTLVAAVTKAALLDTLKGTGPFTVFAPTNEAFALLNMTQGALLARADLKDILTYHVAKGKVKTKDPWASACQGMHCKHCRIVCIAGPFANGLLLDWGR